MVRMVRMVQSLADRTFQLRSNRSGSSYNDADVVYRHPNGACFFIGNQSIASNKEELKARKIFKIVPRAEQQEMKRSQISARFLPGLPFLQDLKKKI